MEKTENFERAQNLSDESKIETKLLENNIRESREESSEEQEKEAESLDINLDKKKDEWQDILGSGGIMKKILSDGQPNTQPERGNKCLINYICSLEDGTVVETINNFEFFLGESDVIAGLDVSLALLNVGEKCLLKIEPRLAFGKIGLPPKIPPNAVVTYEVELISVELEDEIESLTFEKRKMTGNKKRERGNWWYSRGENNLAIQCYRKALDYLDESGSTEIFKEGQQQVSDADLQSILEDRISVYNNMAAAQIKMRMYDAALNSLQTVLRCQPNNVKAHFRKAKAFIGKNELSLGMQSLKRAKELAPNDVEIIKEINNVVRIMEKEKKSEKEMAKRMFCDHFSNDNTNKNNSKKSKTSKVKVWAALGALVAVGVAGLVTHRLKYS